MKVLTNIYNKFPKGISANIVLMIFMLGLYTIGIYVWGKVSSKKETVILLPPTTK